MKKFVWLTNSILRLKIYKLNQQLSYINPMEDNSLKIDSSKIKDANIININDMLEVYCENDKNNRIY